MKVLCCNCNAFIGEKPDDSLPDNAVSHGLCPECAHHFLAQYGMSLEDYIEGIAAPVVAVTSDGAAAIANNRARKLLGKIDIAVDGYQPGEVFECEYALLPEGCGRTFHCSGCAIRYSIMDTLTTGRENKHVPVHLRQRTGDQAITFDILISTWKQGGVVMLAMERLRERDRAMV